MRSHTNAQTLSLSLAAAALLMVSACGEPEEEAPRSRACAFPAFFEPSRSLSRLAVVGDFNDWSTETHPMVDPDGDGIYQALIEAGPGRHTYRIYADGQTFLDRYNPLTLYKDDAEHSLADLSQCAAPTLEVQAIDASSGGDVSIDVQFLRGQGGAPISPGDIEVRINARDTSDNTARIEVDRDTGTIDLAFGALEPGKYQVRLRAADTSGQPTPELTLPIWIEETDFDWRDAIIYQVFVDRFRARGRALSRDASISEYRGGDLWGVIDAIEEGYFEALGVNTLWVSPLYDNPDGSFIGRDGYPAEPYHGYWPSSPRSVEERFGGEEALDAFVKVAHANGLRVLMDAVLNHVHVEHPYFEERVDQGWFNHIEGDCICGVTCPWSTHMTTCWFDPFLADLSWEREEVVDALTADALYWLERFDLDGLRIDAVPMMPRLAVRHLRHKVKGRFEQGGGSVYLLGETFTGVGGQSEIRRYIGEHALSGQFDYPVMWALRDAVAGRADMDSLDAEVRASEEAWEGSGAVMAPILGNHDVSRFISDINNDRVTDPRGNPPLAPGPGRAFDLLQVGWTFLMTQIGAPIIYYGDEIGIPGGNDPDNRRNMAFGDDVSTEGERVLAHVQRLGAARKCSDALRRGVRQTLEVRPDTYIYGRDAGDGHPAVVVLNASDAPRLLDFELPEKWALKEGAIFEDLLGAPVTSAGRQIVATVPPRTSMLLMTRCLDE